MHAPIMKNRKWFDDGFGMSVLNALERRLGDAVWPGVFHTGGIHTGTWIVAARFAEGRHVYDVLSLYETEADFLEDN